MLDAPLSAAGREFGGYKGFNEGFGFLDPLMDMTSGRGCSNSGDSKRFLHKTAGAPQMRKRAVTLEIPRGCARYLYRVAHLLRERFMLTSNSKFRHWPGWPGLAYC